LHNAHPSSPPTYLSSPDPPHPSTYTLSLHDALPIFHCLHKRQSIARILSFITDTLGMFNRRCFRFSSLWLWTTITQSIGGNGTRRKWYLTVYAARRTWHRFSQ